MATTVPSHDWLVDLRREFHRYPEPGWCEFWTTDRIIRECEAIGVDDVQFGPDVHDPAERAGVPDEATLEKWRDRAEARGANPNRLERMAGGFTGAIATLEGGDGPTVALRVDIDALPQLESDEHDHTPAADGFRSGNEGYMHACGHDAHMTMGLGVLGALADADLPGTLKVLFQPAEELIGGARPMAESGHLDDVDSILAVHIGLDYDTGEVVAGLEGFLAVSQFRASYTGSPAHAGGRPNRGDNAVQALAAAIQGLYGIPRHEGGATRVNAGRVEGGTATNIIPESATLEGEVRGDSTDRMEYMREHANRVLRSAADMHDCEVDIERFGQAPTALSDDDVVDVVAAAARKVPDVTEVHRGGELGGSEDASLLMRHVQKRGGRAAFVCVGTDHPGGHHTATFDVDEASLELGVGVLVNAIEELLSS
jgi:aminobenzoyl-glutamate utilization protein A